MIGADADGRRAHVRNRYVDLVGHSGGIQSEVQIIFEERAAAAALNSIRTCAQSIERIGEQVGNYVFRIAVGNAGIERKNSKHLEGKVRQRSAFSQVHRGRRNVSDSPISEVLARMPRREVTPGRLRPRTWK